jgi:hypothetical protein
LTPFLFDRPVLHDLENEILRLAMTEWGAVNKKTEAKSVPAFFFISDSDLISRVKRLHVAKK